MMLRVLILLGVVGWIALVVRWAGRRKSWLVVAGELLFLTIISIDVLGVLFGVVPKNASLGMEALVWVFGLSPYVILARWALMKKRQAAGDGRLP